jgi:hypothetical protein
MRAGGGVSAMLEEALAHLARGWALLPVTAGKEPAKRLIRATRGSARWRPLADSPACEDEVRAWLELDPATGIAVLTGEPSGIVVVDVDDPVQAPPLPETATVTTGRGRHSYFARSSAVRTRAFEWGEIRGEGSYVVAPCSRHGSGRDYEWELTPEEMPLVDFVEQNDARRDSLRPISSTGHTDSSFPSFNRSTCPAFVDLDRDERAALQLAEALGAPEGVGLGEPFSCVLHADRSPSACLWRRSADAHVLYHDWHAAEGAKWLPLALVRARLAGRLGPVAAPELLVWKLRLAHEAGLLEPVRFVAADAPPELELAWNGFLRLLGLRWSVTPRQPAPFSARFAAAWCGLSRRQAHEAVTELTRLGLLRPAGRDVRGTRLWLPEGVRPIANT